MNTLKRRQLIREYIRYTLAEGDLATMQALGATGLKGLVQPFADVANTAIAGVLGVGSSLIGFAKTLINTALMAVIPFARADYAAIKQENDSRAAKIRNKFKDVYARTEKELGSDGFQAMLFAANPAAFLALNAGKLGDDVLAKNYSSLTGKSESKVYSGLLLNEAITQQFIDDINKSPIVKDMQAMGLSAFTEYLSAFDGKIGNIDSVDTLAELERLTGKTFEDEKLVDIEDEEERKETESAIVDAVKKGYKKTIADDLETEAKAVADVVGNNSPVVAAYNTLIGKLK